jgi:hypothetical protein
MKVHRFYCARMVSLCASGSGVLMVSGTASHSGALGALARSLTRRRDAQWLKGIFRPRNHRVWLLGNALGQPE